MAFEIARRFALPLMALATFAVLPADAGAARKPPVLTGGAVIHDLAYMNGHYCFAGHVHFGSSSGQPTQAKARSEALISWFELVNLEYGDQWSNYAIAASKKVACSQSGTSWGCEVHAIPCSR